MSFSKIVIQILKLKKRFCDRVRFRSSNITILSNNCVGGVIYHKLGLKFMSPTINSWIGMEDFLWFVNNLEEYKDASLVEDLSNDEKYPVGILEGGGRAITIHFMHYNLFEEAKAKWEERFLRINYNNICVIAESGASTTREVRDAFAKINYRKKVLIINDSHYLYPNEFYVDIYDKNYEYGKLLWTDETRGIGEKIYLDRFDYVEFLNTGCIRESF